MEIKLYGKLKGCRQCKMTKDFLINNGVEFEFIDVLADDSLPEMLKDEGFMSVPVIEVDGIKKFAGFRPDELAKLS